MADTDLDTDWTETLDQGRKTLAAGKKPRKPNGFNQPLGKHPVQPTSATERSAQNWRNVISRVTRLTVGEAVVYFGELAQNLSYYPSQLQLRELMVFRAVYEFIQSPNPGMLNVLMEREEGKVPQTFTGLIEEHTFDWAELAKQLGVTPEEALKELPAIEAEYKQLHQGEVPRTSAPDSSPDQTQSLPVGRGPESLPKKTRGRPRKSD